MATGRASKRADSQIPYCKDQGIPYLVGAAVNGVSLVSATIEMPADGVINFAALGLPDQAGITYQVHIANHAAGAPAVESGAQTYAITNGQTLTVKVDREVAAQTATINGTVGSKTCATAEPYALANGDNLVIVADDGSEQEVTLAGAGAVVTSGAAEPFVLAADQTWIADVNGVSRTATFEATAASVTCANSQNYAFDDGDQLELAVDSGGSQLVTVNATPATALSTGGAPFALTNNWTLLLKIDREGSAQTITFLTADFVDIAAATAAEVAAVIARDGVGLLASVSGDDVRITSRKKGTGSYVEITGGTAQAELGFAIEEKQGTGDAADLAAMTAAEVVTLINGDTTLVTASVSSSKVKLTSDKIGTASHVQVLGGAMNDALGFATSDNQGTGCAEDITAATALEVAAAINADLGAYVLATTTVDDKVRVTTLRQGTGAAVQVTGGTANGELEFDTDAHAGSGDAVDLGAMTAAEVVAAINTQTTGLTASVATDKVQLDSDSLGTGSMVQVLSGSMNTALGFTASEGRGTGDAHTLAAVTAAEIAAVLNSDIVGAVATVTSANKVRLRSKTVGASGFIEVTGGTANGVVGFSTSEVQGSGAVSAVAISDRATSGFTLSGPGEGDELDILVVGPIAGQLS